MRKFTCAVVSSFAFAGFVSVAEAQAKPLQVVSGTCQLESSKETVKLVNVDPMMHYGMFAEGFSSQRDRIYLQDQRDSVVLVIQGQGGMAFSRVDRSATGPTKITTGVVVNRPENKKEWLSCDLQIQ